MDYRRLPLISGVLISFSLFLNFFASSNTSWLIKTYPPIDEYKNNLFMQIILWITLFLAISNNISLSMRLFEKSVVKTTDICIMFSFIQGVMLVCVVIIFSFFNPLKEELEYSEGYFSAIQASCITFIGGTFLYIDKVTTADFEAKGSGFSRIQRKLVILVTIAILYVTIGTYVFMKIEPWSSKESVFFIVSSLTTIGFGNRSPKNDSGRLFMIFYSIGGVACLAYTVAVISDVLKENIMVSFQTKLTMFREKRYERIICDNESDKEVANQAQNSDSIVNFNEFDDDEEERRMMLEDQKQNASHQFYSAVVLMGLFWIIGALSFHWTEQWDYIEAFYFCFIAFSTIGFGDLVPTTSIGLSIFNVWIIFGIATMTFLASAGSTYITYKWSSQIDEKDEPNELESALDILRGNKTKKDKKPSSNNRKFYKMDDDNYGEDRMNYNVIPLTAVEPNVSSKAGTIIESDNLENWEDATKSFEQILKHVIKISNASKILETNINSLKDKENNDEIDLSSLDSIERSFRIIEKSCKIIKDISIGEDTSSSNMNINNMGTEDEQTLIMHSREQSSVNSESTNYK